MQKYIDIRSDTVTLPTEEMLDAMRNAISGDDVYEDDPTVNELERKSAGILGKEAALFVPSGTFANQLAIMTHTSRGEEIIVPEGNHIVIHEVGASAVLSQVQLKTIKDNFGEVDISLLEKAVRPDDIHFPKTGLICMENAHSSGKVVSLRNMKQVYDFAGKRKIPVHLDGARIFNAAVVLKAEAAEIAGYADSVMFCLSKGLCCPIGSVLAGSYDFIKRARKNRKLMGGGLRQAGYIAAPGLIALEKMTKRLGEDHEHAKYMAAGLDEIDEINILKNQLDINMVFFTIKKDGFNEKDFIKYLEKNNIKINPPEGNEFRFVTHYWIKKQDVDYITKIVSDFFKR
ncbi:MAG TPA: low-specificity L-threonine aldolase [Actinobacteria bacterium]|nr:low-specificity L-threonine aldolase [Actinomycetota bacterium]